MKNKIYLTTSSILLAINITGCTLLPYEETFICNKGLNSGSCQSVSENYRDTFVDKNGIKRRRSNIRKYNNKWKRYNFYKRKKNTIFKKKYGNSIPRF